MLLGALAGYAFAQRSPDRYKSDAVLIIADGDASVLGSGAAQGSSDRAVYMAKQVQMLTSSVVLQRAAKILGGDQSVELLRSQVAVGQSADMATISIGAT